MRSPARTLLVVVAILGASRLAAAESAGLVWERQRQAMVDREVVAAGIGNDRVVRSMRNTPRHEFVPLAQRRLAYLDMALPIGSQQTISPPFVVAYMTERLDPQPTDRVLEIGTGSGYQAAVLSPLVADVYSIEIVPDLGRRAAKTLKRLGYGNVHTRIGDGFAGWPEAAPFDKIIVTCSPESPPQPLVEQLAEGGVMVIPVGERHQQNLVLLRKEDGELVEKELRATLFVPMTGDAERRRERLPDPLHPVIANGGFETQAHGDTDEPAPAGWHYLRRATLVGGVGRKGKPDDGAGSGAEGSAGGPRDAAEGDRFLRFECHEPGLPSQALQGFAIDGRRAARLRVSLRARGEGLRPGRTPSEQAYAVVTFYDERRAALGEEAIGPLRGSFPWTPWERVVVAPAATREAILRVGLLGGTGRLDVDDVRVEVAPAAAGRVGRP